MTDPTPSPVSRSTDCVLPSVEWRAQLIAALADVARMDPSRAEALIARSSLAEAHRLAGSAAREAAEHLWLADGGPNT